MREVGERMSEGGREDVREREGGCQREGGREGGREEEWGWEGGGGGGREVSEN